LRRHRLADERADALRPDAGRLDERPAVRRHRIEGAGGDRPEAGLDGLASAAGRADVVAARARGTIEDGSEPILDTLDGLERGAETIRFRRTTFGLRCGSRGRTRSFRVRRPRSGRYNRRRPTPTGGVMAPGCKETRP